MVTLGLGGFFVMRYLNAGIIARATEYFDDHNFKNYELISSLGITEDDLSQIKEVEGITDTEGVIRAEGSLQKGELDRNVEIISMTERISVPEVLEGKAPAAKDECMIGEDFAATTGLKVGDKVRLTMSGLPSAAEPSSEDAVPADEEDKEEAAGDVLISKEFTVTALMRHPDYFRRKAINTVVLPWAAYDRDALDGYYTHAFVKAEEPEGEDIFSDGYFEKTAGTKQKLEELTDVLAVDAAQRAKDKANARIDEEWQKALDELEKGQNEIDRNEATLNDELAAARKKLNDAQKELDSKAGQASKKIRKAEKDIAEAKETLALIDENLPDIKEYLKELRGENESQFEELMKELTYVRTLLDKLKGLNTGSEEFQAVVKELARFILDNEEKMHKVRNFARKDEVMTAAEKIRDAGSIDATGAITMIRNFDIEGLCMLAQAVYDGNGDLNAFVEKTEVLISEIEEMLNKIAEAENYVAEYEQKRADLYKQVADKEAELNAAKKKLASEKNKYRAKIRNGWSLYYSQKESYESKLEEAKALLAENREAAEEKLAEARAEVEKIECKWLVFDRRGNSGYVDVRSAIRSMGTAGTAFGLLFLLISAIVCFSTLSIIIEEQKKMVGTVKAFGFHKGEILGKYMVFGLAAAGIGGIASILTALGLSGIVLKAYNDAAMYQFDNVSSVITPGITIIACVCMMLICALATVIACSDVLKSPASVLMKGGSIKKESNRKQSSSKRGGSLYSRLILRNMLDDKARVIISILIIAFSTLIIGAGISTKLAFDGMKEKQLSDIYNYDIKIELGDKVSDDQRAGLSRVLHEHGTEFTAASLESHLYRWDDNLDVLNVLTGDPDEIGDFIAITDTKTGEALPLPDDGVLVQKRMRESYKMVEGTEIPVMDSGLDMKTAVVKGEFQNYVGRLMVTSPKGYREIFGEDPAYNSYYVRTNGADINRLKADMFAITNDLSFEEADEFASKSESVSFLYNMVVILTTGIAILMSFMILTNLANIFLNRKKTELTVMRINGFSIKQTKGYLARETVVTTAAGLILGVIVGAIATPFIIMMQEQPDLQFIRSFHPLAWIAAVVMEALFAVLINSFVFRKVKDLNFRDIA